MKAAGAGMACFWSSARSMAVPYRTDSSNEMLARLDETGIVHELIAKNTEFVAQPGTPQAQVVAQGFSDS